MNRRCNLTLTLLVATFSLLAQDRYGIQLLNDSFDVKWSKGSFSVSSSGLAFSNALNTGMYSNVLFSNSFSNESKNTFYDLDKDNTKLMSQVNNTLEYKIDHSLGLRLKQSTFIGFRSENEFSKLLIFGNKRFQDQTVASKDLRFIDYTSYSAGITNQFLSDSKKWRIKTGLDLQLLGRANEVSANNLSIYTAERGEELLAQVDQLAISRNNGSLAGVGVNLDLDFNYLLSANSMISVDFKNLNFNRLFKSELFYLDSSFSFTGVNSFGPRDSIFANGYLEKRVNEEVDSRIERRLFIALPSNISISYSKSLKNGNMISAAISTTDLGVFGTTLNLGYLNIFNPHVALRSSLGYGDFSGIIWTEEFEYALKNLSIKLDIINLHSLVLPHEVTSYGAAIGVSSHL